MKKDRIFRGNTFFALGVGVILLGYLILRIVFPKNHFDSKKSNMTVTLNRFEGGEKSYFAVAPHLEHNYYAARVDMRAGDDVFAEDEEIKAYKGFLSQLYPVGQEIEELETLKKYIFSDSDIPNGHLVENKDAIYFYSRGKFRPFLGPTIFEGLGLDWERVRALTSEQRGSFEEGERIIFRTPHPDGTILVTKQEKFFLVWEEELLPIESKALLEAAWKDYFAVRIDKELPREVGSCGLDSYRSIFKCKFNKENRTRDIAGNVFLFETKKDLPLELATKITLETFNVFDSENALITLSSHKNRLSEKYKEELFK